MSRGGSGPAGGSAGLRSRSVARCSCRAPLSSARLLASGPRICINLDGLMWGDHQLDFPCGSGSQLGLRGLPLAAQPGARWRVMACGGSGADVPHCARTQKRAGLDFFLFFSSLTPPFLLSFSFSAVTLTANSYSSLYLFILLRGGEGCEVADSVFHVDAPALRHASVLRTLLLLAFILCLNMHMGCTVPCTPSWNILLDIWVS